MHGNLSFYVFFMYVFFVVGKEYGGGAFLSRVKNTGGGIFVARKEYGQKCEWGTKINPCAIISTGAVLHTALRYEYTI